MKRLGYCRMIKNRDFRNFLATGKIMEVITPLEEFLAQKAAEKQKKICH